MPKRTKKDRTDFSKISIKISKSILNEMKTKGIIRDFFYTSDFVLINSDCLDAMSFLISKGVVVDHIITDIPYGTIKGLSIEGWKKANKVPNWDCVIDKMQMFENCFDISKANSNLLLFCQEPLTTNLINSVVDFQKYSLSNKLIWVKNNHANGFGSKHTPLNYYEEILLIRKSLDSNNSLHLRDYFRRLSEYIPDDRKQIMAKLGQGLDHCFRYTHRTFYLPTEANYNALISTYHIDKMPGFINYDKLKNEWKHDNKIVFNIPEGNKIVKNVFVCKKDTNNIHPTQKPLNLLKELIKIFSDTGDTILDFASGSGSTGIAAIETGRKFIGIELDEKFYFDSINWYKKHRN